MRKYFVKVFKGIEHKLLKALYKGCMDTIEEYQNDIKTISFQYYFPKNPYGFFM